MKIRESDLRRAYVREHPLALSFAAGAIVVGLMLTASLIADIAPPPSLEPLAPPLRIGWAFTYAVGGLLACAGVLLRQPRLEAPGFALLASALGIATVTSLAVGRGSASGAFLLSLAFGSAARAISLTGWTRRSSQR